MFVERRRSYFIVYYSHRILSILFTFKNTNAYFIIIIMPKSSSNL